MFFFNLVIKSGRSWQTYHETFGPFDNLRALNAFATETWPNEKRQQLLIFEAEIEPILPTGKELPEDQKRQPDLKNYVEKKDELGWNCRNCGATVLAAEVAHSIWITEGAGFGECTYEQVPYCPNCDKKPNFQGYPIDESGRPWRKN